MGASLKEKHRKTALFKHARAHAEFEGDHKYCAKFWLTCKATFLKSSSGFYDIYI